MDEPLLLAPEERQVRGGAVQEACAQECRRRQQKKDGEYRHDADWAFPFLGGDGIKFRHDLFTNRACGGRDAEEQRDGSA
ncbi:hypothetical protein [Peterkaempfera griseoplana]|uniref:hypothetical protein n=1 Tax=Peterkaempfera griseoplana TaxID=66896 RepID=UPI0012FEAF5D|nr:hypothetical protein [Peterkaempfera griseoplana]